MFGEALLKYRVRVLASRESPGNRNGKVADLNRGPGCRFEFQGPVQAAPVDLKSLNQFERRSLLRVGVDQRCLFRARLEFAVPGTNISPVSVAGLILDNRIAKMCSLGQKLGPIWI